ncbi:histidine kinase [Polaribacter sp. ALD11]|uniref:Hpt domain-containing protein n=1 Tax=Polaribacter sp. ALD11 TaxID=2058137 RepID=UPI000C311E18|nr:Hpt domain-containing protein [Polaribacter sp. ALD11]AUC86012.1 histidine kinase [Polaribacter sp. ALD11]
MEIPNLDYLKEISGGDLDFENAMLSLLKLEFPAEYTVLKMNFDNNNFDEIALDIHKIKHKIGMLGMEASVDLASKCEKNIKNGNTEEYRDLVLILERINVYLKNK